MRNEFYNLMQEGMLAKNSGILPGMLDKLADDYIEKSSAVPTGMAAGLLGAVLATLAAGSYGIGYNLSKGNDPMAQKAKALKVILNRERLKRHVPLELIGVGDDFNEDSLADMLGTTRGSTYQMPILSKTKKTTKKKPEDSDIEMSLGDLYGIGKSSAAAPGTPIAGIGPAPNMQT